jgi:hypothetical protein
MPQTVYPTGMDPDIHLTGGWVGPLSAWTFRRKEKSLRYLDSKLGPTPNAYLLHILKVLFNKRCNRRRKYRMRVKVNSACICQTKPGLTRAQEGRVKSLKQILRSLIRALCWVIRYLTALIRLLPDVMWHGLPPYMKFISLLHYQAPAQLSDRRAASVGSYTACCGGLTIDAWEPDKRSQWQ